MVFVGSDPHACGHVRDGKLFLWLEFADEVIDIMWNVKAAAH